MGVIDTKTFKSGNSVAVRLPKELGFTADMAITIEQKGQTLTIRPAFDPIEEKRKVEAFVAAMLALGPVGEIEQVRPSGIPDRDGV